MMQFRIKELREEKQMSQEKLSELSNVSRTIISGLETNKITQTSTTTLMKIAGALGVKVSDIFF
jgi:transcriptional regulator with XRE-family HTH domain